ncbi:MAG: hypothetical protein WCK10_03170 [Candidatus Staskawiczbacteria bacterium]
MQKIKLTLALVGLLALPVMAFAIPAGVPSISGLTQIVTYIENALWIIFGLIAVICFVMAGILFLTAGGQPEKVQSARSAFIWGIAGVVVGIVAYSIVQIVSTVMQGGA